MPQYTRKQTLRRQGKVAVRQELPSCQAKANCPNDARLDCKSWDGRWGFTCARCWPSFALRPNTLGTGVAQYLVLRDEGDADIPTWVR